LINRTPGIISLSSEQVVDHPLGPAVRLVDTKEIPGRYQRVAVVLVVVAVPQSTEVPPMADYAPGGDYDPATAGGLFEDTEWAKSSASEPNGGNCVEVNVGHDGLVGLRDSKLEPSPVFVFDAGEWAAFLTAVKAGQFDLPEGRP
jgi:hypothetical protein